ncbi:hypothetical protein AXG55_05645 [Silvanigrella aquatica]|uniref:Uncharacterized protein n=1 Tax=Silvanigrella aquatica TaxID=1915309 RepID=A0A1L4CZP8_9BACT|nr:hypothetical protein AXG55_05645 [Silvanigrella aquatica]
MPQAAVRPVCQPSKLKSSVPLKKFLLSCNILKLIKLQIIKKSLTKLQKHDKNLREHQEAVFIGGVCSPHLIS